MNKKPSKGASLRCKSKSIKTAKKSTCSIKNEDKELDMDSLVFLDNAKERKKLNGIDEKIKLLKTELKSLLGATKTDDDSEYFTYKSNLVSSNAVSADIKNLENLGTNIKSAKNWENLKESQLSELDTEFTPSPLKISHCLDKTVEEFDTKYKNKPSADKLLSSSKVQMDLTDATLLPHSLPPRMRFDSSIAPSFSQQDVECLLYKSFLMQNSDFYVNSSEACSSELNSFTNKKKKQNNKGTRKSQKKCSRGRRPNENNFSPYNRFLRRRVASRMLNSSICLDDIEVINLDSSSNSCKTNAECVDLDVSTYDWSEPFNINEETDIYSDVQIVEDSKEKNDCINQKELNNPEVTANDRSFSETGEIQPKTVWECPVCFERSKGQEIVATQCGHVFCRKCLEDHISKLCKNCPSCRSDLKDKPFITLFNF